LEDLNQSVRAMESRFSEQLERRDRILKGSRDVIAACSRTIIDVHTRRMKEASEELQNAKLLLGELKKSADPSVARYLVSPEAEFVEASAVLSLARGKSIPSMKSLESSPEAYLLGLLDTVGEMKRLVLDSMMHDKMADARRYFDVMQEIYSVCSPLAVFDHVANGARRKIDVARMLVEDTRGFMAEETRRGSMKTSMARLEKKLSTGGLKSP
jgi:translin